MMQHFLFKKMIYLTFQMVSLLKLAEITEEGVKFRSPYDDSECMLTPERSIEIQVWIFSVLCFYCSTNSHMSDFEILT